MRRFFSGLRARRQPIAKPERVKPCIEHLEDRCVLSAVSVTTTADVRSFPDSPDISLRDAVQYANANSGEDTLSVPAGTYLLSIAGFGEDAGETGDLDVTDATGRLILEGAGVDATIFDADDLDRMFDVAPGASLVIRNATIRGGDSQAQAGGGLRNAGRLELENCLIVSNTTSTQGGGLHNAGEAYLERVQFKDNFAGASGGAISTAFQLMVRNGVFESNVAGASVTTVSANGRGGAVYVADGVADLSYSTFRTNRAGYGGAVATIVGTTYLNDSYFTGNLAESVNTNAPARGGAVQNGGEMYVNRSTFYQNDAGAAGGRGGAFANTGTLSIKNATLSDNRAGSASGYGVGGGIYNIGNLEVLSSTVAFNLVRGGGFGGGIETESLYGRSQASAVLQNTIVAQNLPSNSNGPDTYGNFISQGGNLIGVRAGSNGWISTDKVGGLNSPSFLDPLLVPLGDYGGATPTHAFRPTSPALDAGVSTALFTDQRGFTRPAGPATDIGAYEFQPHPTWNTAPNPMADTYAVAEESLLNASGITGVLNNDSDDQLDVLAAQVVSQPRFSSSFTFKADGSFTYRPRTNFYGTDTFTYRAYDGMAYSDPVTVTINVAPTPDAPTAFADQYTIDEDTTLTAPGGLSTGRSDQSNPQVGLNFIVSHSEWSWQQQVRAGQSGVLSAIALRFSENSTPGATFELFVNRGAAWQSDTPDWVLPVTVTSSMVGHAWLFDVASAGIMLKAGEYFTIGTHNGGGAGSAWLVGSDSEQVGAGYAAGAVWLNGELLNGSTRYGLNFQTFMSTAAVPGVLTNDIDPDGDSLHVSVVSGPSHGSLTLSSTGSFNYTPAENFVGTDTFTYRVNDGTTTPSTATVTINVRAVNDPPAAHAKAVATNEDSAVNIIPSGTDIEGSSLTFAVASGPSHGTVTVNADGTFRYTPTSDFHGSDSFTYTASDGQAASDPVIVSITVQPTNDVPMARADSASVDEDGVLIGASVLLNDTDADGDSLSAILVSGPAHGSFSLAADGAYSYTPSSDYNGSDSFVYAVSDGIVQANATVTITVRAVADAPVAEGDTATTDEDVAVTLNLLANDRDADADQLAVAAVAQPVHGSATLNADGTVSYHPSAHFNGTDTFNYTLSDATGLQTTGTVTITVRPVNDAAAAAGDSFSGLEDTALSGNVLTNDTDVDTPPSGLSAVLVANPSHGTLQLNANGTFTYQPSAHRNGNDTFSYKVWDGEAYSDTVTVSLVIAAANDAPVAIGETYSIAENSDLIVAASGVMSNDIEYDGDPLTARVEQAPASGSLTLNPNGSFTYRPGQNFSGTDTFSYRITDPSGASSVATVTINIRNVIDIKPGDNANIIDLGRDTQIAVAILSSASFDATRQVQIHTLRFGKTGNEDSLIRNRKTGQPQYAFQDVNGDGRLDLVAYFQTDKTALVVGDTIGRLTGTLLDGSRLIAMEYIKVQKTKGR